MFKKTVGDLVAAAFSVGAAFFIFYLTLTQFVIDKASGGGPFANSAFYPQVVAGVIIFLALLLTAYSLWHKKEKDEPSAEFEEVGIPADQPGEAQSPKSQEKAPRNLSILIALMLVLYTVLVDLFGYVVVTPFLMGFLFWVLKVRKPLSIILLSLASTWAMYFFFQELLDVILPPGRYSLIQW